MTADGQGDRLVASDVVVVVGTDSDVMDLVRSSDAVLHTSYASLSEELIATYGPGRVICPLIGDGFDAYEVASLLQRLAFKGRLDVLTPGLPSVKLVSRELRLVAPGLEIAFAMVA